LNHKFMVISFAVRPGPCVDEPETDGFDTLRVGRRRWSGIDKANVSRDWLRAPGTKCAWPWRCFAAAERFAWQLERGALVIVARSNRFNEHGTWAPATVVETCPMSLGRPSLVRVAFFDLGVTEWVPPLSGRLLPIVENSQLVMDDPDAASTRDSRRLWRHRVRTVCDLLEPSDPRDVLSIGAKRCGRKSIRCTRPPHALAIGQDGWITLIERQIHAILRERQCRKWIADIALFPDRILHNTRSTVSLAISLLSSFLFYGG